MALFEEQDFRGRALVAVPKDSPLGGPGGLPLDAGGIAQALGPVAALGGVLVPGGNVAGGVLASAILAPLAGLRAGENVRFERADANNQISDFYDLTYPQTGFHRWSAEDIMTSFVVVGEPRTVVHFFNAPDADSREGSFQVTVGNDRLVRCRSLRGQQPQSLPSEPPEAVTITMAPDFWKWTENVKTFENELSSLRFGG
ncbi:MAG TPA: hypothetical protein VHN37_10880 [Actinomycetota bacterium]|nr:hypothetical protein [Actinomycetota bacterium]